MIIDVQIWPSAQICTSRGAKGPDLKGQGGITAIVMFKMKEGQFLKRCVDRFLNFLVFSSH